MGCRILEGEKVNENDRLAAVFYDSVTEWAFGPVMADQCEAEAFMSFLRHRPITKENGKTTGDPRAFPNSDLWELWGQFVKEYRCDDV